LALKAGRGRIGVVSEAGGDVEQIILGRVARLQALHAAGDKTAALRMHAELVDEFGLQAIVSVMADRADRQRLVAETELVQLVGTEALGLGPAPREP
jgi:hypothetical protein